MPAASDPFDTTALRDAAVATWLRDPSRLRQDANLEEDHARGYYRDRVVVELTQNAADAAVAADAPGRLLLRLTTGDAGSRLLAANTGAPLTADGVAALASMRASAKRAGATVGRFGVGFAAVRSVSDEIAIATRTPDGVAGVTFSLGRTRAVLDRAGAELPALGEEVARRHGDLPALRLPFPASRPWVPDGYVTAVTLELRGPEEVAAARAALAEVSDATLLALPALTAIVVEVDGAARTIADAAGRWLTVRATGTLEAALLADRPVEERERSGWSLTWALPRRSRTDAARIVEDAAAAHPGVVHAPTPTDEPCTLPALLVASLPLDPTRRHVAAGPLTDALVARAGELYAELAEAAAEAGEDALALVPTGLPAGQLDAALHGVALAALRAAPLLPEVGGGQRLSARAAQALAGPLGQDAAVLDALAPMVGGLVHVPPGRHGQARVLGVALRDLADVVDALPAAGPPERWREVYGALGPHAAAHREALAGLPVPLADGRTVRGARGVLLPTADLARFWAEHPAAAAAFPGLRVVHPGAAHPALHTLGAVEADAATVLAEEAVRAAVEAAGGDLPGGDADLAPATDGGLVSAADGDLPPAIVAVLDLAQQSVRARPDTALPDWLADLPLPGDAGAWCPAAELVLPGSWAAGVLDALDRLAPAVAARWDAAALRAVGVRADLVVTLVPDVVAEPAGAEEPVEGWADYLVHLAAVLGPGAYVGDLPAVADLDAVADDAWPALLARLAEDRDARAALLTEVRAVSGGRAPGLRAPSYTAWWLREELGAPFVHPRAGARARVPFLPDAPAGLDRLDDAVLAALGAVGDLDELEGPAWEAYVAAWPARGTVPMPDALALWHGLARAAGSGLELAPEAVPVLDGGTARMVPADDALVGPPMWAQVGPVLPVPAARVGPVADLLDLDAAGEVAPMTAGAVLQPTPPAALAVLPGAPTEWWECEELHVEGADVEWWAADGAAWATTTAGLARALAHAAEAWPARHVVEAALAEPDRVDALLAELAGG
ncbi:sacsin N-terminal ATP-binding-like domain-containing protein [Georgenia ruanii]|uniref:ATP-binding protein n=1 Tax=Georgenia ruanii TaxID=348442 RepID=A0A7J9V0T9_9MICO|nr:ATP-binding protein [Georgenia ruanii]MPV90505.1 ATP-binding protein [Georgenia ruanii]